MRARPIEELTILVNHPPDVLIAQDQNMVRTFAPDGANEPFAESVCFRGKGRGMDEFDASTRHRAFKMQPILVIVIADQEARGCTERGGFPHLLREPGIGGSPYHADMHHSSGAMLDDEEQKH